jgi:hypothetical protein
MPLKLFRMPLLLAALESLGSRLAFGHEDHETGSALATALTTHVHFDAALALLTGSLAFAWLGVLVFSRLTIKERRLPSRATCTSLVANLAGGALLLLLWMLPWLSLHDTHHALETGATTCTVAQIAHSQAGGVLQSTPSLIPLAVGVRIEFPVPVAPPSLAVPRPAARSPPL